MKFPFKGAVVFALACVAAIEAAVLIPRMATSPDEAKLLPESMSPVGASYLSVNSTEGLPGVQPALRPAQVDYQVDTTKEVADYIVNTGATEEARLELARKQAEAKAAFLEEQQRLALEYAELQKELAAANAGQSLNDSSMPSYAQGLDPGVYIVGEGDTISNPSSIMQVGSNSSDGDTNDYQYVPNVPGSSLTNQATSGTSLIDPNSQGLSPATGGTLQNEGNIAGSTGSNTTMDSYYGEFSVTFICTCTDCFNPTVWPSSRLNANFMQVPTAYITPGTLVRLEGAISGYYDVEDGDSVLSGRSALVFHADHSLGAGQSTAYVKLYKS